MPRLAPLAPLVLVLSFSAAQLAAQSPSDEQSIRALAAEFERAWNTHDMNVLGAIATDDIDFVNVAGLHWKGRTEVVQEHAARHKVRFRNSVWTTDRVSVQFVASGVALVHVDWQTRGDLDLDLKPWPPRKGLFSWLVVKQGGGWKIRSAQNTDKS